MTPENGGRGCAAWLPRCRGGECSRSREPDQHVEIGESRATDLGAESRMLGAEAHHLILERKEESSLQIFLDPPMKTGWVLLHVYFYYHGGAGWTEHKGGGMHRIQC